MNVRPIDPTSATLATQAAAVANPPAKLAPATTAAPVAAAAHATPAVKVTLAGVPASVKSEDRALYMQILKSVGGNTAVALATLQAREASEGES